MTDKKSWVWPTVLAVGVSVPLISLFSCMVWVVVRENQGWWTIGFLVSYFASALGLWLKGTWGLILFALAFTIFLWFWF